MDDENQDSSGSTRVAMDPKVTCSRREIGGRTTYVMHHAAMGKFFQLGAEEYRVVCLLDGTRTLSEIVQLVEQYGIRWEDKEVAEFVSKLVTSRLAKPIRDPGSEGTGQPPSGGEPAAPGATPPSPPGATGWSQRSVKFLSMVISQRFPLFDGQAVATRLEKRFGSVFSLTGTFCWAILVFSGLAIVAGNRKEFTEELQRMFDPGIWLVLLAMWVVAKIIHELGHAVAARHHGVRVGKLGIMFFFLAPLAYVDVTDAWKLKSRWSRVQIAMAGVYLELGFAAMAAWTWWFLPDGMSRHLAAQFFFVAGPATLLVNANPLLRLDGYYVVSDLTEIPNLRMHGRAQLTGILERWLLKITPQRSLLDGWRRTFATIHAACSVVFQVLWMGGLVIGVSIWAKGLGILLALAAVMLWAILPLSRWVKKIWLLEPGERWHLNDKRKQLIGLACLAMLLTDQICTQSSPFARRIPVVVQFHDQQVARATADAFVSAVYVTRGQRVKKGALLLVLEDPELKIRREQKADDLQIARLRAVQLRRQGDLSQAAAEQENAHSLSRQLAELDAQVDGLKVVAQRDGLVLGPEVNELEGRFVHRGDELLRVSDPQEKELLASVNEDDMQAYTAAAMRSTPASIRLRGGTSVSAIPAKLRPRARHSLPHPALAATVGGPLPVEPSPDENGQLRVIQPQLQSLTELDPVTSVELRSGQIGTMTISDDRSLAVRFWDSVTP